jgi:hypothetical protein
MADRMNFISKVIIAAVILAGLAVYPSFLLIYYNNYNKILLYIINLASLPVVDC